MPFYKVWMNKAVRVTAIEKTLAFDSIDQKGRIAEGRADGATADITEARDGRLIDAGMEDSLG